MPAIATSTSAVLLANRNRLRKSIIFQNEDTSIAVFLKKERANTPTVSSTDHDHRLGPGGSLSLNHEQDGEEAVQEAWTVIAASGTPVVSWFETEDVVR